MQMVAVLYADPRGVYPKMPGVDVWCENRDARKYEGPHPVVAHPPCTHYGRLRHLARKDDADCAPIAVEHVRRWSGVLEHPRGSVLWPLCGMALPGELPDAWGGVTMAVDQCDWGHVARKATWLYIVGVRPERYPRMPRREPTHWISGGRGRTATRNHTPVPPGIKVASAQQRRRTPAAFAEFLVDLARLARK